MIEQTYKSSPRAITSAIELLSRWQTKSDETATPLDRIVSGFFRSHHELNSGERRWISATVFGTARLLRRQQFLLEKMGKEYSPQTLVELWLAEERSEPETAAALELLPGIDAPGEYLRITQSFPDEMASELEKMLGNEAAAAGQAFNLQAPITLRVNPLRATMERARHALPDAVRTTCSPWGLDLPKRVNLNEVLGYREGWYEVQEEASQLAALLSDVKPNMNVIDVAAGAGGKTLAMAALMQGQGTLTALDTDEGRLEELRERAKRAKVPSVEWIRVHLNSDGLWKASGKALQGLNRLYGQADCVLVDAPCTGSGAIRRSPDARWRTYDLDAMCEQQFRLLEQGAALAKPGGAVVYITCAFERRQNEEIIDRFLQSQTGEAFEVDPAKPRLESAIQRAMSVSRSKDWEPAPLDSLVDGPYLRTWPHRHNMDAFFGARLVKRKEGSRGG